MLQEEGCTRADEVLWELRPQISEIMGLFGWEEAERQLYLLQRALTYLIPEMRSLGSIPQIEYQANNNIIRREAPQLDRESIWQGSRRFS